MNTYLQYILTIFGVITMCGVAFAQFRKGSRGESSEIIKFYKEEALNYKDMLQKKEEAHTVKISELTKDFTEKINGLSREVGELRGQLTAEKKQNERFEQIFQNRNPEMEKFMTFMVNTQKEVVDVLKEIHAMTKAEHDRDFQVTSTITKTP